MELAAAAATACPSVEIELDGVESMTQEAAALLLFRDAPWRAQPEKITLRAGGRPGRQAVLAPTLEGVPGSRRPDAGGGRHIVSMRTMCRPPQFGLDDSRSSG